MNFYDIYTTLSLNPEAERSLNSICQYIGAENELESVKTALWNKPNRAQHSGAFPFDEETGKIYDALWKAADAEHFTLAGRFGRWLMKTICPPADDEGMGFYHKTAKHDGEDEEPDQVTEQKPETDNHINTDGETKIETQPPHDSNWQMSGSDEEENVIVIESKPQHKEEQVVKRSKKGD